MRGGFKLREGKIVLREADVSGQIIDWLCARRWRCSRQQSALIEVGKNADGSARWMRIGEKGRSDFVCWRPLRQWMDRPAPSSVAEMFFLEIKAPGKKPTAEQLKWLSIRRQEGFLAVWSESLSSFVSWYCGYFKES